MNQERITRIGRRLLVSAMLASAEFALGSSQTALNAVQTTAMTYLSESPRNSTEFANIQWLWSVAVSTELAFAVISAIMFKSLADRFGRRRVFAISGCMFCASFILQFVMYPSRSIYPLMFGRLIMGIAFPVLYYTLTVFIVETITIGRRGLWTLIYGMFFALGMSSEQILAVPQFLNRPDAWPYLLLLVAIYFSPALAILAIVPETPRFLYFTNADREKLDKSLNFYNITPETLPIYRLSKPSDSMRLHTFILDHSFTTHKIVIISYAGCVAFAGGPAFSNYLTDFAVQYGIGPMIASGISAGIISIASPCSLLYAKYLERHGRRRVYKVLFVQLLVTLLILLTLRLVGNPSTGTQVLLGLTLLTHFLGTLTLYSLTVIVGEILPNNARASGYAVYIATMNGFGALTTQFFNVSEQNYRGLGIIILIFPFIFFACIFLIFMPETIHCSVDEAEVLVRNRGASLWNKCIPNTALCIPMKASMGDGESTTYSVLQPLLDNSSSTGSYAAMASL